ncbi:MAG TPA: hypothetical protein VFW23_02805 [Tepidisphaeraceae bacterium]|nr:hypothetical protein [Tepidisphaeraceae bacterium]
MGRRTLNLRLGGWTPVILASLALIALTDRHSSILQLKPAARGIRADAAAPTTGGGKGTFTIIIKGTYSGTGTATVGASSVTINASVTDQSGASGTLSATGQTTDGSHFSGAGTVMGQHITFDGRADAQDPLVRNDSVRSVKKEQVVINPRMTATFHTDDNQSFGRVVGTRPNGRQVVVN